MKTLTLGWVTLTLTLALALWPQHALAACRTHTYMLNGQVIVCTVCCTGNGNCTTTCT